jgi:signal transduction histidine kinase/DNA-binding response OmpR family regulator/ligand-binding sensor domain-containing protein
MIINQRIKTFISAFVALLMLLTGLYGTNLYIDRTFYSINEIHGLSLRMANSVTEDDNGFIWVSSKTGILRLTDDDSRSYFLPYQTPDVITVKLVYGASGLIAYSNNGQFFKYDNLSDQFVLYFDLRPLLGSNRITVFNVLIDQKGILYIPTNMGLYSYSKNHQLLSLIQGEVRYIDWFDQDHMFISKEDGIHLINTNAHVKESFLFNEFSKVTPVSTVFYDKDEQKLWIGTQPGYLLYLSLAEKQIRNVGLSELPRQPILAIEANTDSTVLVGYDGQGVWELNRSATRIQNVYREDVNNPLSLRGNGVYDIYKDSNERIWICTYSGGVSFFEQSSIDVAHIKHVINNTNSLVNNVVNDVFEDAEGNIWFATNNGISRWKVSTNQWDTFLRNEKGEARVILSVFGDSEGKIWAGTWSAGLFVLDAKTGKTLDYYFYPGEAKPDIGDNVFDITEDSQGDLWLVGVVEEVLRYSRKEKKLYRYGNEPVYVIKELNDQEMLLGCSFGLMLLNKSSGKQEIILDGYIILDFIIMDNEIWCGTSGGGLIRLNLNDRSYEQYTMDLGLPSNFVNSIYYLDGYMWLGTENGLCRFSPGKNEVLNYSSILPLANLSLNSGAVTYLKNGQLIFGTNQGAILFNPHTLEPRKDVGRVFIQDVIISGRSIREPNVYDLKLPVDSLQTIHLTYNQRTISFELLPKGLSAAESKISWKIDALDDVWSTPSSNRVLTFANLPSGKYELRIRMYNNSLTQIIDERKVIVHVSPPFWKSWWFFILLVMISAAILYFALRYHISLLQKLHSEEKIEFFANTTHEIRTSLTLIGGPMEEIKKEAHLSERGRYYLSLATGQVNNLLKVATQLLDFQKFDKGKDQLRLEVVNIVELIRQRINMFESYAENNKIKLTLHADVESAVTTVDIDKMSKVFDNLISNAIKYSHQGGEVQVFFYNEKNKWVVQVKDQGIGISSQGQKQLFKEFYRSENAVNSRIMGSGIGLLMVRSYVENHNGRVSFTSEENMGSSFKIKIPYLVEPEKIVDNSLHPDNNLYQDVQFEKLLSKSTVGESGKLSGINILVVEDNDNLRGFIYVALGEEFHVRSAVNGKQAWGIIQEEMPDLVISDIMMPEMDGFELCRLIKSTYETSHIAVILLTALSEKADQLQGIGLGADDYLTKPFDMNLLIGKINSIISNRKAVKEKALKLFDQGSDIPIVENELNDQFVKKAFEVVRENISNSEFGKDKFASEMNVSSSLLYKKIKSLTDQSPTDFIKTIRLKEARNLLHCRKYSITEVSELCGFASVGYFSTVFKKHYGKTPSEILEV